MGNNAAGGIRKSAVPLLLVLWLKGMPARFRTDPYKVDVSVTIKFYLSNIFDPIIITLHEQHRH